MKLTRLLVAGVTAALSLMVALPAQAHEAGDVTVSFFHSPNADARWVHFVPPPPGDPDTWSIRLRLGTTPGTCLVGDFSCYAGAQLNGVAGPPPPNPPSFDYYSTVAGPSGGSPRLHMDFSDGGSMDLRPLALVAGSWVHEDGSTPDWDNNGGTCGFRYEVPYAVAVACHPGATVTGVIVVTDSSWALGPYTHYIDNIQYGNALITSPEGTGCHEGDGDGHFKGDHGNGDVHFNGDGCMDGEQDQDQVSSHDRGDGKDFQSTRIDSISVNPLGNTMTIAGAGTSAGAPVTFVLVAVESTPLTPGTVTMTFSDGFTNTGDLLDGSIALH